MSSGCNKRNLNNWIDTDWIKFWLWFVEILFILDLVLILHKFQSILDLIGWFQIGLDSIKILKNKWIFLRNICYYHRHETWLACPNGDWFGGKLTILHTFQGCWCSINFSCQLQDSNSCWRLSRYPRIHSRVGAFLTDPDFTVISNAPISQTYLNIFYIFWNFILIRSWSCLELTGV